MPAGQRDRVELLMKIGIAALVQGAKAVPGVGSLLAVAVAGAGEYLEETISAPELPKQARDAVRQLAKDYRELLASEVRAHPDDNALELALTAMLEILSTQGLSVDDLVEKAGLNGDQAARLTLQRKQVKKTLIRLYDTKARELTERLVREYYRILLSHKDALNHVGVEGLRVILNRLPDPDFYPQLQSQIATIMDNQRELLGLDRSKAWRKVRWPDHSYDFSWGLQPLMLRPEYQLVDYVGQEHKRTRDELLDWLRSLATWPRRERIGFRCYVGPAGAGKTRLLLETGGILRTEGWFTGFLAPGGATRENAHLLLEATNPTLLVLDYAGARASDVEVLLNALASESNRQGPYALVLLARSKPDWLQDAVQPGSNPDLSGHPELRMIETIESNARLVPRVHSEDLPDLYRAGVQGLAIAVDKTPLPNTTPPNIPSRPLYVLMLALLAVAGESFPEDTSNETSILDRVWEWVLCRWRAWLKRDSWMELGWIDDLVPYDKSKPGILEKLQVVTTLGCVFISEEDLAAFLKNQDWLPRDKFGRTPDILKFAHNIAQFLPSHQDQLGIVAPIEPDPLADRIIHRFLVHQESILDWLNNSFPAEDSTSQAALVFHRLLASSSELHIEDTVIIGELCKWADHRLQPTEITKLLRDLATWIDPYRSISEQYSVARSIAAFQENIPKDVFKSESKKGTINRDILSIINQPESNNE